MLDILLVIILAGLILFDGAMLALSIINVKRLNELKNQRKNQNKKY